MNKKIFVWYGLDHHIDRLILWYESVKLFYPSMNIGLATVTTLKNDKNGKIIEEFSKTHNIPWYHSRQLYNNNGMPFEIIGMFDISNYYTCLGYEHIYLLHSDILFINKNDITLSFEKKCSDNWSFVVTYIPGASNPHFLHNYETNKAETKSRIYNELYYKGNAGRGGTCYANYLTQTIILFNSNFIKKVYSLYTNEKMYNLFAEEMGLIPNGDVSLFLFTEFCGYEFKYVVKFDPKNRYKKEDYVDFLQGEEYLKTNNYEISNRGTNIYYVHYSAHKDGLKEYWNNLKNNLKHYNESAN